MASQSSSSQIVPVLFLLLFVIISVLITLYINGVQSVAYMDEIFHIPQAQKYCKGKFDQWDPKLTTPPGLYVVTVGVLVPISKLISVNLCEIIHLRCVNLVFAVANVYLIYCIISKLNQNTSFGKLIFTSLNLAFFPVLYFFTFLYYTDVGSTFFVLLAYLHSLYGQNVMASAFGAISMLFRQTNIIWIFFMAGEKAVEIICSHLRVEKKKSDIVSKGSFQYLQKTLQALLVAPYMQRRVFLNMLLEIFKSCFCYLFVFASFLIFIIWNDGIAVGDRTAHQISLHLPQFFYFLGFTFAFSNTYLLNSAKYAKFMNICTEKIVLIGSCMLVMAISLRYLSYVHIYLLSDNRHYTFYIWRYFLGCDGIRYLFIPVYIYAGWSLLNLFASKNSLWKLLLTICVVMATAPQQLLELRYFIMPYLIIRIHTPVGNNFQLIGELFTYLFVNAFTIYVFTQQPFIVEGISNQVQRFMW